MTEKQRNDHIIEMVKEITIAKMSNTTLIPNKEGGENVADFMQVVYDKIVELDSKVN